MKSDSSSNSSSKNVLVIGGAGYIGSHTCLELAKNNWSPITFDNLSLGHRQAIQWGDFFEGDILDPDSLDQAMIKFKPAAVMHFAAFAAVGESMQYPDRYYRNNIVGTLNLLDSMNRNGVKNLIFSSSAAVYGIPKATPIPEDHPTQPINPYGRTKLMMEEILKDYDRAFGIRSVSLRYFNAAGADMEGNLGENHNPETHLIPRLLKSALGQLDQFQIFGEDYNTPDGTCIRDYIHVSDLARAHVLALDYLNSDDAQTRSFNLGTRQGYSVRQVWKTAEEVIGKKIEVGIGDRRPGDPDELVADSIAAQGVLDWKPQYSDLNTIVDSAYRWLKEPRF